MAITKISDTPVSTTASFVRRVEERTYRVIIETPLTSDGVDGYYAVAYREWIEYRDGVVHSTTKLPPLPIKIDPSLFPMIGMIAGQIDTAAAKGVADQKWPKAGDGTIMTP